MRCATIGVPLLWAMGGLAVLAMAGLNAIIISAVIANKPPLQDTYYVVAHRGHAIGLAAVFGVFAGWYHLFPRATGWSYSVLLGKVHFWLSFLGVSAGIIAIDVGLPVLTLADGRAGIVSLAEAFGYLNLVSLAGACVAAAGTLVFFVNMALAFWRRRPA